MIHRVAKKTFYFNEEKIRTVIFSAKKLRLVTTKQNSSIYEADTFSDNVSGFVIPLKGMPPPHELL